MEKVVFYSYLFIFIIFFKLFLCVHILEINKNWSNLFHVLFFFFLNIIIFIFFYIEEDY